MSINIATKEVKPLRLNYAHIARRIGDNKPATRYQEAVYDMQPEVNFHYPPSWEPNKQLFDPTRTAIVMRDWYAFTDPRQYYYSAYVAVRARQQESVEKNFEIVEERELLQTVPADLVQRVKAVLIPLRHVEYGANMNNQDICDRGYGVTITSLASFNGFDRIGMAQYVARIALLLDSNEETGLLQGREDWLQGTSWQPLRHALEDMFVLEDWFELMVAQNIVLDGLLYPLVYERFMRDVANQGGVALTLLTQFMLDWYGETVQWTNALLKVTAAESPANAALLSTWIQRWTARLNEALLPIADLAFPNTGQQALAEVKQTLLARISKQGVQV